MTEKPDPKMATKISAVVCEHGNLYIRLHDQSGTIFAAGCMSRDTGFRLIDSIMTEFISPSAECGGLH